MRAVLRTFEQVLSRRGVPAWDGAKILDCYKEVTK
jgi:hypothetical protein